MAVLERENERMIDDTTCQRIADWSHRMRVPGAPDARAIVDRDQPEGEPLLDEEQREARLHPADFLALRRWADRQPLGP